MRVESVEPPDISAVLAGASRGEAAAWEELVRRYARRIFALARSRCRRCDLAEEVTQSVFVTMATKLRTGGYTEQGRFESWLFRVAMNRVRDEMRRARRRDGGHMPGDRLAAPPQREREGDAERLRACMALLPENDRDVLELRHHAGLSFRHIAELLDEPMGTVLARHHRALRKLKEMMERSPRPTETRA